MNLNSITVSRNPTWDNDLSNKNYVDDELDRVVFLIFNQTRKLSPSFFQKWRLQPYKRR